jgi:hypothetical protein
MKEEALRDNDGRKKRRFDGDGDDNKDREENSGNPIFKKPRADGIGMGNKGQKNFKASKKGRK